MLASESFMVLAGARRSLTYTVATTSLVVKNLRAFLIAQGVWNGSDFFDFSFVIPAGRSVWSNDKAFAAIEILSGDFPAASTITIANAGLICGKGDWAPAGGAIRVNRPVIINNTGTIAGGGSNGAGGSGQTCQGVVYGTVFDGGDSVSGCNQPCTSGSGSNGYGYGYSMAGSSATNGSAGSSCGGSSYDCSTGDSSSTCNCSVCPGGGAGHGGGAGSSGYAVSGNVNVTWINTGTRYGSVS